MLLHLRAAFIEGRRRERVDPQPDVHHILAPDLVPVFAGVAAGVAQNLLARLHALEKLHRKTQQGGIGQPQPHQSFVRERNVHGGLRLTLPALAGRNVRNDLAYEIAPLFRAVQFQQQVPRERKVVAAQYESLYIGDVQFNHVLALRVRPPAACAPPLPYRPRVHAGALRIRRPAVPAHGGPYPGTAGKPPESRPRTFPG